MYVMKISNWKTKQLYNVRHYNHFLNALADMSDFIFCDNIPDEVIPPNLTPNISYHGDKNGVADDFEFKFQTGLLIYIGTILVEDGI